MKWLRNLLKGASLTTALFVFEACYGPPFKYRDIPVEFLVVSAEDESPLKDIEISYESEENLCGTTGEDGRLYTVVGSSYGSLYFHLQDPENVFAPKDTVLRSWDHVILVKLQKQEDPE